MGMKREVRKEPVNLITLNFAVFERFCLAWISSRICFGFINWKSCSKLYSYMWQPAKFQNKYRWRYKLENVTMFALPTAYIVYLHHFSGYKNVGGLSFGENAIWANNYSSGLKVTSLYLDGYLYSFRDDKHKQRLRWASRHNVDIYIYYFYILCLFLVPMATLRGFYIVNLMVRKIDKACWPFYIGYAINALKLL